MRLLERSFLALVLLLSACDRKEESPHAGAPGSPAKPVRSESRESREEEEADPREVLRDAFASAGREVDPAARERAFAAVAWDGIDVDPELAREAFAELAPGGDEARRLVGHFAMRLADDDPEGALAWARSLQLPEERGDAIGRIAVVLSTSDAARAATLISEEVPEGLPRDRAAVQVVQRWTQSAPAEAAAWVASFPAGKVREAAVDSLAAGWLTSDVRAYESWALTQPVLLPEAATAAAKALGSLSDGSARSKQLATFSDPEFRRLIQEQLAK
jgi:hypothetical protein